MNKQAYFKMFGLQKTATTPGEEIFASQIGDRIFPITRLGDLVGRISNDNTPTQEYDADKLGYIPGISGYRVARRRAQASKLLGSKNNQAISQLLGPVTSTLTATGLGAIAGGAMGGPGGAVTGALVGGGSAVAAWPIAALAALIKRKRTAAQQKQYEDQGGLANYLIPGKAVYGNYKTKGFLMGDEYKQMRNKAYSKNKKSKPQQKEPKKAKKVTFS